MRRIIASIFCIVIVLSGCKNSDTSTDKALLLRNRILNSNGCSFSADVTADYGEKVYQFTMDCETDSEGNLKFTVTAPTSIEGITGKITDNGGGITFDDKVLAFQTIADDQVTPVTAPWLLLKTLRSGYIRGCTDGDDSYQITIDDSYEEEALRLHIYVQDGVPVSSEIFWKERRILTVTVENFNYL